MSAEATIRTWMDTAVEAIRRAEAAEAALSATQEENRRLKETNRKLHRRVQIAEATHQSIMSMSETWGRPSKAHDEWARGWHAGCRSFGRVVKSRLRRFAARSIAPQRNQDHGAAG